MTIASSANAAETEAWLPVADDWLALAVILMLLLCAGVEARMPYLLRLEDDPRFAAFTRKVGLPATTDARALP